MDGLANMTSLVFLNVRNPFNQAILINIGDLGLQASSQVSRSRIRASTRKLPLTTLIARILTTLGTNNDDPSNRIQKLEASLFGCLPHIKLNILIAADRRSEYIGHR